MCLYTKQTKPKIAGEDITCYKWLTKDLKGPSYGFQYTLGELSVEELGKPEDGKLFKGLHTYAILNEAMEHTEDTFWNCIHWKPRQVWMDAPILVKCIIPKGSEYYQGYNNEFYDKTHYTSNQLILKEIIYDATKNAKN